MSGTSSNKVSTVESNLSQGKTLATISSIYANLAVQQPSNTRDSITLVAKVFQENRGVISETLHKTMREMRLLAPVQLALIVKSASDVLHIQNSVGRNTNARRNAIGVEPHRAHQEVYDSMVNKQAFSVKHSYKISEIESKSIGVMFSTFLVHTIVQTMKTICEEASTAIFSSPFVGTEDISQLGMDRYNKASSLYKKTRDFASKANADEFPITFANVCNSIREYSGREVSAIIIPNALIGTVENLPGFERNNNFRDISVYFNDSETLLQQMLTMCNLEPSVNKGENGPSVLGTIGGKQVYVLPNQLNDPASGCINFGTSHVSEILYFPISMAAEHDNQVFKLTDGEYDNRISISECMEGIPYMYKLSLNKGSIANHVELSEETRRNVGTAAHAYVRLAYVSSFHGEVRRIMELVTGNLKLGVDMDKTEFFRSILTHVYQMPTNGGQPLAAVATVEFNNNAIVNADLWRATEQYFDTISLDLIQSLSIVMFQNQQIQGASLVHMRNIVRTKVASPTATDVSIDKYVVKVFKSITEVMNATFTNLQAMYNGVTSDALTDEMRMVTRIIAILLYVSMQFYASIGNRRPIANMLSRMVDNDGSPFISQTAIEMCISGNPTDNDLFVFDFISASEDHRVGEQEKLWFARDGVLNLDALCNSAAYFMKSFKFVLFNLYRRVEYGRFAFAKGGESAMIMTEPDSAVIFESHTNGMLEFAQHISVAVCRTPRGSMFTIPNAVNLQILSGNSLYVVKGSSIVSNDIRSTSVRQRDTAGLFVTVVPKEDMISNDMIHVSGRVIPDHLSIPDDSVSIIRSMSYWLNMWGIGENSFAVNFASNSDPSMLGNIAFRGNVVPVTTK